MKTRLLALAVLAAAAGCAPARGTPAPAPAAGDPVKEAAQDYLEGVLAFAKGDYGGARKKWERAKELDPASADAKAGLERLDQLQR
jgi:hypothetical protein